MLESRWPELVESRLRTHVAACPICAELAAAAGGIDSDQKALRACAAVPDSGRVWWIAQLRARREAAQAAERPITAVQMIAFGCAVGLLGACFGATSTWFQSALRWAASSATALNLKAFLPSATALVAEHGILAVLMAAVILLAPAAVYFAVGRE